MTIERWQIMWGLAVLIFFLCKWTTWQDAGFPFSWRAVGYWFAWPGLDAKAFLYEDVPPEDEGWLFALVKTFLGFGLYFEVARQIPSPYWAGWVGMIGIVFMLHFGIFHMLSCVWRSFGVNAEPLMNWPILATNLANFWGARWNTAFRNLTHKSLFRPLLREFGTKNVGLAVLASFIFSGIIHDAVISLPSGDGYGGPTLFFLLQGVGILLEWKLRKARLLEGWKGRVYAMAFLILPVGLLFHPPFVLNIIVPFMKATGALP